MNRKTIIELGAMFVTGLLIALTLIWVGSASGATTTKALAHRSAEVSQVLDLTTTCVPEQRWRSYLYSIGVDQDTAWVLTSYFANDWETTFASVPDDSCRAVTRSWGFPDMDVAIPLYYFAELVAPNDSDRAIRHSFYSLRRAFGIRRSVTVSDFFPDPPPGR